MVELLEDYNYPYNIQYSKWYQAMPYAFSFQPRDSTTEDLLVFELPISPQNLTITTNFATNVVTTLYGIVEEHSEIKYFDIQIAGTTGYSPNTNIKNLSSDTNLATSTIIPDGLGPIIGGRKSFASTPLFDLPTGGFAQRTMNILQQIAQKAIDTKNLWTGTPGDTGVAVNTTGYIAFHNLYRFFLLYKEDASAQKGLNNFDNTKKRTNHPLTFLNYKDGNKYDCVPLTFTLTRDASNPMLYNYNIRLRAYNLRSVNESKRDVSDIDRLSNLGLVQNGQKITSQSLYNKLFTTAANTRAILAGTISGVSTIGQ